MYLVLVVDQGVAGVVWIAGGAGEQGEQNVRYTNSTLKLAPVCE